MRIKTSLIAFVAAAALTGPALGGTKDDIRDLQARLLQAEQALAGQGAVTVRMSGLERQNQELTGRIEELSYKLEQANYRLDAVSAALSGGEVGAVLPGAEADAFGANPNANPNGGPVDLMAGAGGSGDPIADQIASAGGAASAPGADAGAGAESGRSISDISLPLDPGAAYDYASGFILAGDYQRGKEAFALYLEVFPNHPRTSDAQFRLGEIQLSLGENAAAAESFIAHIRNYPNDRRAAEAYLKLGTAFAGLDKASEACTVFKTMKSKHPNAAGAVLQRADLEMARIDCK